MFSKKFTLLKNPSSWRRLSIATWKAPNDPTVYIDLDFDFEKGLDYISKINASQGIKISPTHFVAKAIALTLQHYPDINGIIKWGRIYLRKTVDIFLQVAVPSETGGEKPDLSGALIGNCDQKSFAEIANELKEKAQKIRKKEDPQFKSSLKLLNLLPAWVLSLALKFMSFLIYYLNLSLPKLGLPEDPFGSAMVTSVGMWNVPPGFAPLVPVSRVPLIACVGSVIDKAVVVEKQIVIRPILQVNFTVDHRFIDGYTGAKMLHYLREVFANPEKYLGL